MFLDLLSRACKLYHTRWLTNCASRQSHLSADPLAASHMLREAPCSTPSLAATQQTGARNRLELRVELADCTFVAKAFSPLAESTHCKAIVQEWSCKKATKHRSRLWYHAGR